MQARAPLVVLQENRRVDDMQIVQVDERDSGWELSSPRFRVYLHESGEASTAGRTDTYDITGADVVQVIDWAQRQLGESLTYAIALVCDDHNAQERANPGRGRGLVWLVGSDGNDQSVKQHEAATQRRMLARRRDPLVVPPADQMPPDAPNSYNDGIRAG
jgi:hypothetical protein